MDRLTGDICKKHNLRPANERNLKLPARLCAVLAHLSRGLSYNEIAAATGLSRDTVKTHVRRLYKRLDVNNAQEAILKASSLGLLELRQE